MSGRSSVIAGDYSSTIGLTSPRAPSNRCVYGLDIETDTASGGLDPTRAAIVAVAVSGDGWTRVLTGAEPSLLDATDGLLAGLPAGILVTWNGGRFDLPYLADRAARCGVDLGLTLEPIPASARAREPLPGHDGGYRASWHHHWHLDAYQVYRADVGASLGLPCGLKPLARFVGLDPVEVDRTRIHELDARQLDDYVASDAVLTRELALRRWPTARRAVDRLIGSPGQEISS